jgi:putative transposase
VREHGTIVIEDLHVAGMLRNRRLARRVAGVGMTELRRQLDYKTTWASARLQVADRWFPSSKTCSRCGVVKAKLRLSERTYRCGQCGLVLDRDLNAARNGPDAIDSTGSAHPGLPCAGCTILGASTAQLAELRAKASDSLAVYAPTCQSKRS